MRFMDNQNLLKRNNDPEKQRRIFFAALSGFVAGTIAALLSGFINTLLFPDLPLYLNGSVIFIAWVLWAVLGGIFAGVAAYSFDDMKSILLSALGMAVTILILNFMQGAESALLNVIVLVGLSFPFTAMMTPLAWLFFWLAHRFVEALSLNGWARSKIISINIMIILALGTAPGVYSKMNSRAERAVRVIHELLQEAAHASAPETIHKALLMTEGFTEHKDQPYTLSQIPSEDSTEGVDVTAHYEDGYTILCTVVLYPGSAPSIFDCYAGWTP